MLCGWIRNRHLFLLLPRCFVGCDGSVLLDDTYTLKGEKKDCINHHTLKGFDIIDQIKNKLELECLGIVCCADIFTVAARDATILVGGPYWYVPLGRKDAKTAGYELATSNLPEANEGLLSMISKFMYQGLSVTDLIALSGGHELSKSTENAGGLMACGIISLQG